MFDQPPNSRTWGFRFFVTDAAAIGVFILAALGLRQMGSPLSWLLTIVAGHFFLFCNVFRVRRSLELGWAVGFLLNAGAWLWFENLDWLHVLASQLPVTVGFIVAELRSRQYHGIGARRINPALEAYLEGRVTDDLKEADGSGSGKS